MGRLEHDPDRLGPQFRLPGVVLRLQDASDHAANLISSTAAESRPLL